MKVYLVEYRMDCLEVHLMEYLKEYLALYLAECQMDCLEVYLMEYQKEYLALYLEVESQVVSLVESQVEYQQVD